MKAETLFYLEDVIFKQYGLYALWTMIYVSNFVVLLCDGTNDESRDFNVLVNGFSVIYSGIASANVIYGNKLPSTLLLVGGPIHQYLYWIIFAYYKGSPVLGRHPIGVMNWISTVIVGIFTLDMVFKTWLLSFNSNYYAQYVNNNLKTASDNNQKVIAVFKFKPNEKEKFIDLLNNPENGISLTRRSKGFVSIDILSNVDDPDVLVLSQVWKDRKSHEDYLQVRTELGMFDQLNEMLVEKPDIKYLSLLDV